jgi:hypothetical protein
MKERQWSNNAYDPTSDSHTGMTRREPARPSQPPTVSTIADTQALIDLGEWVRSQ